MRTSKRPQGTERDPQAREARAQRAAGERSKSGERPASVDDAVVVSLGGVVREVLHELPIVSFWVMEVDALAVGMGVRDRRVLVAAGPEARAHGLGVVH